jgi:hypothetical protein
MPVIRLAHVSQARQLSSDNRGQPVALVIYCNKSIGIRGLLYCRSLAKLPSLAPGDLDLAAVIELNV